MITPKDKGLAITEGPWTVKLHLSYPGYAYVPECMGNECSLITAEDATLFADAGNTYNSCQMLPSQMVEKLREAEKLLRRYNMNGQSSTLDVDVFNFLSKLPNP